MCHHHPQQTFFLSPCQPDLLILCGDGKAWESINLLIPDGDGKLEMWCACVISERGTQWVIICDATIWVSLCNSVVSFGMQRMEQEEHLGNQRKTNQIKSSARACKFFTIHWQSNPRFWIFRVCLNHHHLNYGSHNTPFAQILEQAAKEREYFYTERAAQLQAMKIINRYK